jgi:hypothetical protein
MWGKMGYVEEVLRRMGFDQKWINLVMRCIKSV